MAHSKKTASRKHSAEGGGSRVALAAYAAPGGTHSRRKPRRSDARDEAIRDSFGDGFDLVFGLIDDQAIRDAYEADSACLEDMRDRQR